MTEPINPSVWRSARRNTGVSASAVRMDSGEHQRRARRLVRNSAGYAANASLLNPQPTPQRMASENPAID
jgi:hypothetical protein